MKKNSRLIAIIIFGLLGCKEDENALKSENLVYDIDRNAYKTTKIGNQIWMAENLRTTHYADGSPIPLGDPDISLWQNYSSKYYFNYDTALRDDYGELLDLLYSNSKLYNWAAATNLESDGSDDGLVQGACPDGWHLPNKLEWEELINFVGADSAGIKLRSSNPTHWNKYWNNQFVDLNGTDEFGFNSIASGGRDSFGAFYIFDIYAFYWSSSTPESELDNWRVWTPSIVIDSEKISWIGYGKSNSFCVRCIKN